MMDRGNEDIEQQRRQYSLQQDTGQEDTIRYLINPKEVIKEKMMILEGFEWDVMKNRWVDSPNRDPKMNPKGLRFALNELNHILNKLIPQSNLIKQEQRDYIMSYSRRVRTGLVTNIENFGIKSLADLDQVKNIIVDTAYFILTQPIDDKARKFIFSPLKVAEQHTFAESNTQPKKHRIGW